MPTLPTTKQSGSTIPREFDTKEQHPTVVFVGGGNMAFAPIGGILRAGWPAGRIGIVEPNAAQGMKLYEAYGIASRNSPESLLVEAQVVVWAVKPQILEAVVLEAKGIFKKCLHVSIAAGVRLERLRQILQTGRLIRAMPNSAAAVGLSMTGMFAPEEITLQDRDLAGRIFDAIGTCLWTDSDERMNAVTAMTGSGPAYGLRFLAALQSAAASLGFDPSQTRAIAIGLMKGVVAQTEMSANSFDDQAAKIVSPRGTTEAALEVLDAANLNGLIVRCVDAAYQRAAELSV